MPGDPLNIKFNSLQLIVSSANVTFDLSMSDYKSVIPYSFHGNVNQQWIVLGDADGQVAIMSKYNKKYIVPETQTVDSKLVIVDVPFWWKIDKDEDGYKLTVPDADLGLNMGKGILRKASEATRLFFVENTDANRSLLKSGKVPKDGANGSAQDENPSTKPGGKKPEEPKPETKPEKGNSGPTFNITINDHPAGTGAVKDVLKELHNFLKTDGVKNLTLYLGSGSQRDIKQTDKPGGNPTDEGSTGPIKPENPPKDPNPKPSKEGSSIFGTSKPKKVVYVQTSLVPPNSKGKADIVGFGTAGVVIWRTDSQAHNLLVTPNFGYSDEAGKWRVDRHVRVLADTTGNGRADIVGFSDAGVSISVNKGDNVFQEPKFILSEFGYDGGWRIEKHLRFVADLRNTGRADVIGFGDQGVYVSLNKGDGTFSPSKLVVKDFGYEAGGWKLDASLRFLADLNGNGLLDIVGFGRQVWVSINNGDGTFQPLKSVLADLTNGQAWYNDKHPRFVADLTGDGKPDLIGIKDDGVYVAFNKGDGTFEPVKKIIDNEFSYNKGWRVEKHPRFIADLTGDGRGDIVGFYEDGVYAAINNGDKTFKPVKRVIDKFSWNDNWRIEKHPRFLADITGDGRADIVAIGGTDVYVSYNDGTGNFGPQTKLVENFGDQRSDWAAEKTVKYVANLYP